MTSATSASVADIDLSQGTCTIGTKRNAASCGTPRPPGPRRSWSAEASSLVSADEQSAPRTSPCWYRNPPGALPGGPKQPFLQARPWARAAAEHREARMVQKHLQSACRALAPSGALTLREDPLQTLWIFHTGPHPVMHMRPDAAKASAALIHSSTAAVKGHTCCVLALQPCCTPAQSPSHQPNLPGAPSGTH